MPSTPADPLFELTDDDRSALIVVVSVIMLLLAIGSLVGRFVLRMLVTTLQTHDTVLLVGAILMIIDFVCVFWQSREGLGKHRDAVSEESLLVIAKLQYAASFLTVGVVACTKWSLCLLVVSINQGKRFRLAIKVLQGFLAVFFVSCIVAQGFRCPSPTFWHAESPSQCPGAIPVYFYLGITNMLTDLCLCILPVAMIWRVQTSLKKKMVVVALFASRIAVPITTAFTLIDTRYLFFGSDSDPTWDAVDPMIWLQISIGLSVITACVPNMKGFFDSFMTGTMTLAVNAPYQLTKMGKSLRAEPHDSNTGGTSSGPQGSNMTPSGKRGLSSFSRKGQMDTTISAYRPDENEHHREPTNTTKAASSAGKRVNLNPTGNESTENLTQGAIHVKEEIEVSFGERRATASSDDASSHEYFEMGYQVKKAKKWSTSGSP